MIDNDLLENFGRVWPRHVARLTQFLIESRRHFDGDLDLFLLMCVIGDRTFAERHVPPEMTYDSWNSEKPKGVRSEDINVHSIASFSGMPRETVRRKLNTLLEKGWVVRDAKGYIRATQKAKEDLEPLTRSSLVYLSAIRDILTKL
jgi:predicted Rossmann fold nucleotide-binding protein DprA/Smf involved in DNA uptake